MTHRIGVDGGGTRTRAVVVDAEGRELGRASVGGAVATAASPGEATAAVRAAAEEAVQAAGVELPVEVLWAGLAGAGHEEARRAVLSLLESSGIARSVVVGTDVEAAFHDAFPAGPGVLLIAGTGSIAWARDASGRLRRVGGRGRELGDEGSGFALGREGLRLVLRAEDGRAPATALRDALTAAAGVKEVDDLVPWTDRATKGRIAALAPRVIEAADAGDPGATEIVENAVAELVGHVRAACGGTCPEVVLWGGLVADGGPLRARVVTALAADGIRVADRPVDPVRGAAELARAYASEDAPGT